MSLKEFKNVRQTSSELTKRWFCSEGLEVSAWYNQHHEYRRLEVTWDVSGQKHLWQWSPGTPGQFSQVDEGDKDPRKNLSPLSENEYEGDYNRLLAMIEQHSGDLPIEILMIFRALA